MAEERPVRVAGGAVLAGEDDAPVDRIAAAGDEAAIPIAGSLSKPLGEQETVGGDPAGRFQHRQGAPGEVRSRGRPGESYPR